MAKERIISGEKTGPREPDVTQADGRPEQEEKDGRAVPAPH